jgi:hypothetical protein
MKRLSLLYVAIASLCLMGALGIAGAAEKKAKPEATISLETKEVAVGVGFSWGSGKLHYQGKTYDVAVDGLTVGSVGASSIQARGDVFHLKKLADFDGTYAAIEGGATAGGGGGALAMRNQNGVEVHWVSTSQGVSLTAGVSGVKLAVKK